MNIDAPDYYLFSCLPVPCVVLNMKTNIIIEANDTFKNEFISNNTNPVGLNTDSFKMWKDVNKKQEILNKLLNNEKILNELICLNNKYGELNYYIINATPINDSTCMATMLNVSDLEKQKIKYEQLLKKYQNIIQMTDSAFVILDDKLIIQETNAVMSKLIGVQENELIGEKFSKIICNESKKNREQIILGFEDLLTEQNGKIIRIETCFRKSNNTKIWMSLNAGCFGSDKIVCFLHDISFKKTEEHLKFINSEKNKDKIKQKLSKFQQELSILAHKKKE